jgi:hypothetical protein
VQDSVHGLKSLRFSDFEVVDLTPVVTGLSTHGGPAGTAVTINGLNFSGSAGRLSVWFGSVPAATVTYVSDAQIVAVAPINSGTVDVRVQSGLTTGANPDNLMSPIFGYGQSPITPLGRFTYGSSTSAPPPFLVVGADVGGTPDVRLFNLTTGALMAQFPAYDSAFRGGVRVALGDVTGDGVKDIVTAPGRGGGPDIRVWDGRTRNLVRAFLAYSPNFTGGVFVAVGDVNGDSFADVITAPDAGGGPHVQVFSGANGALLRSFLAYSPNFFGGVRIAIGDITGDSRADLVTAPGAGGGPHVIAFDGVNNSVLHSFMAYSAAFTGGVYVAAGDVNGDGRADMVTSPGAGGGPHVLAFNGTNRSVLLSFLAYAPGFTGGVRVGIVPDVDGDGRADILTAAGPGGAPHTLIYKGTNAAILRSWYAYDPGYLGGIFVGG